MKTETPFLDFYNKCVSEDSCCFLCIYFGEKNETFNLFIPDSNEINDHIKDGYSSYSWGVRNEEDCYNFSDLRQNIVLFCAAINNEL